MTTALQFLNEIADSIRAKGRLVEVTTSEESFGTFVWMSAPATAWYDRPITFSVTKSNRTGQWSMGTMSITTTGKVLKPDTRRAIRIAAEVYA